MRNDKDRDALSEEERTPEEQMALAVFHDVHDQIADRITKRLRDGAKLNELAVVFEHMGHEGLVMIWEREELLQKGPEFYKFIFSHGQGGADKIPILMLLDDLDAPDNRSGRMVCIWATWRGRRPARELH